MSPDRSPLAPGSSAQANPASVLTAPTIPSASPGPPGTPAQSLGERPQDRFLLLSHLIATACGLSRAAGAAILLYDHETERFVPAVPSVAAGLDERWLQRQGLEAFQMLALKAVQAQDIVACDPMAQTPALDVPFLAGGQRPAGVVVLPLALPDTVVGVLGLFYRTPLVPLSDDDRLTLRSFAALSCLALDVAQRYESAYSKLGRLHALDAASQALAGERVPERMLLHLVELATRLVGARYGALGVVGSDGYLTDFITTGLSPTERAAIGSLPRGHGLLGVLIRDGQPLRVSSIARDPRRIGFPAHHPPMSSLLGVPVRHKDAVVGDLYLTDKIGAPDFSEDDQHLVEMLAAHAGIAIENLRLTRQETDLVQIRERERISRDLHDGIIQDIYGAILHLEVLAEDHPDESARATLTQIGEHLSGVISDVRTYIENLPQREMEGRSLSVALAALVRDTLAHAAFKATYTVVGVPQQVPDHVSVALMQITRESLSNGLKHAEATEVTVCLTYAERTITVQVVDNGKGFDPTLPRAARHRGIRNLHARSTDMQGEVSLHSAPGAGTTITVRVPL